MSAPSVTFRSARVTPIPASSAWLTGLKETISELPDFVHVAAELGVREVYLQRLVFFEQEAIGRAPPGPGAL